MTKQEEALNAVMMWYGYHPHLEVLRTLRSAMITAPVKRSDLEALVQSTWQSWANSNSGLAAPVMLALERAVELAGGVVEEDTSEKS